MLRSKTLKIKYMILTNASLNGNKTNEVKNEITNITAVEKKADHSKHVTTPEFNKLTT